MANKAYPRSQRVAQQIQRTLSELIRREVRDPRLGMLTLTEVRLSKDMSYATIYYSVLGADQATAKEVLDSAADFLRGPVGRGLGWRHSPHLNSVRDELIESGARLSGLINKAVNEDVARHVDDPQPQHDDDESDAPDYDSDDDDDAPPADATEDEPAP